MMEKKAKNLNPSKPPEITALVTSLKRAVLGLFILVVLILGCVILLVLLPQVDFTTSDSTKAASPTELAPDPLAAEIVDGKDVATGLMAGEGLELVKGHCTACHSSALIIQNRFTREGWHSKIVWMQETQGLWDLGDNESKILDYLAEFYAPEPPKGRRIPLQNIEWYELKD